jgi:1-acyl-sn-glycerol-3-phosphate acyltransferase
MMDPVIVDSVFRRGIWYLAKAPLFANPIAGAILRAAHLVPIYRRQDNADMTKNADTFRVAAETLRRGAAVAIFPEGTSMGEMRLLPLKSGVARIAFQAEASAGWSLNLRIQSLGITYSDMYRFRSSATVTASEPIVVSAFRSQYESDPGTAVDQLMERVESDLRSVTVDIKDQAHAALIDAISRLYRSRGDLDDRQRLAVIVQNVERAGSLDPALRRSIQQRLDLYLEAAAGLGLAGDEEFGSELRPTHLPFVFPFVILGAVLGWLPYRLVGVAASRYADEPVYVATTKFVAGMILFPLWFGIIATLFGLWADSLVVGVLCFLGFSLAGFLTNRYLPVARMKLISLLWPAKVSPFELLQKIRDQLITDLESFRIV